MIDDDTMYEGENGYALVDRAQYEAGVKQIEQLLARVAELEAELNIYRQSLRSAARIEIANNDRIAELEAENERLRNKKCIRDLAREFAQSTEPVL